MFRLFHWRQRLIPTHIYGTRSIATTLTRLENCPECDSPLPSPLPACVNCRSISPLPQSVSYHHLLDLPNSDNPFRIDTHTLRQNFLKFQRVCHPDTWQGLDPERSQVAAQHSTMLNKAYNTLKNPLSRAQYLIAQHVNTADEERETLEDKAFIMEVMDAREGVEDAAGNEELESILNVNQGRINLVLNEIEQQIGLKQWQSAKAATIKLKYLEGIQDAARQRL